MIATPAGFLIFCVAIYVIACDLLRAPRMHALQARLVRERNRNRFGEVRTKLVRLAVTGELNPKSQLFESIYQGTTRLMRNPHAFEAAAQAVLMIPAPERQVHDRPRPTRLEGEIARDFAGRIDLLCRDYSKAYMVTAAWILGRQGNRIGLMVEARERLESTARLAA